MSLTGAIKIARATMTVRSGWAKYPECHQVIDATLLRLLTGHNKPYWESPQPQRPYDRGSGSLASYGTLWRSCSYCGSIHPQDLIGYLSNPSTYLELAAEKYGRLHKIYVSGLPNSHDGMIVQYGTSDDGPMYGKASPTTRATFYTIHLGDALNNDSFRKLAGKIEEYLPNIKWHWENQNQVMHEEYSV